MLIYHWHPETKQLIGSSEADESPLEPGIFLIPAYATNEQPPEIINEHIIVWGDNKWIYQKMDMKQETKPVPDPCTLLRNERNNRLAEVDWIILKSYSNSVPVPKQWVDYMQALRDLPSVSQPKLTPDGLLDISSISFPIKPI